MNLGAVFSIPQFCSRNGIGRTTFYYLKKLGRSPAEMRIGTRVTITPEAESLWRARMINEPLAGGVRPAAMALDH